ncbi:MAG: DUF1566 domain-containing protein [Spirochaetaceae bacterium]|nr:DUF1566 domain-containing protein [Spirochaetaceae bacterium]
MLNRLAGAGVCALFLAAGVLAAQQDAPNLAVVSFATDVQEKRAREDVLAMRELSRKSAADFGWFSVLPNQYVDEIMALNRIPSDRVFEEQYYHLFYQSDVSFVLSADVKAWEKGYRIRFIFINARKREYYQSEPTVIKNTGQAVSSGVQKALFDFFRSIPFERADFEGADKRTAYAVGDRGPAGGIIFYAKANYSGGWRYLEAAPADVSVPLSWGFSFSGTVTPDAPDTGVALGDGKWNTELLFNADTRSAAVYAAKACKLARFNGFRDWHLPSRDELQLLYQTLAKRGMGGFKKDAYWSSSQSERGAAWFQTFQDGKTYPDGFIGHAFHVRPIRAF